MFSDKKKSTNENNWKQVLLIFNILIILISGNCKELFILFNLYLIAEQLLFKSTLSNMSEDCIQPRKVNKISNK